MLHTRPFAALGGGLAGKLDPPGIGGGGGGPPIDGMGGGGGGGGGGAGMLYSYRGPGSTAAVAMVSCFCEQSVVCRLHADVQIKV